MTPDTKAFAGGQSPGASDAPRRGLELRRLADVWYRRRGLVVALVVVTLVGTEIAEWLVYPSYSAAARLLIEAPGGLDVPFSREKQAFKKSEITQTQSELVLSRPNLEDVIHTLRLDERPRHSDDLRGRVWTRLDGLADGLGRAWQGVQRLVIEQLLGGKLKPTQKPSRYEEVLAALQRSSNLAVEPVTNTDVIQIVVHDRDPETAAAIANRLAEVFLEREMAARKDRARETHDAIEERLKVLRPELDAARDALAAFKNQNQVANLDGQIDATLRTISMLELTYWDVSQKESVRSLSKWEAVRQHATAKQDVDVRAKSTLVEKMSDLAELEARYQPDHEKVKAARAAVEELQRQIGVELDKVSLPSDGSTGPDTESLKRSLLDKLESLRVELARLTRLNSQFSALTWDVDQDGEVLKFLVRKREDALTAEWTTQAQARVIEPAKPDYKPESPVKWRSRMLALITSLAVAITWCALLESVDSTLRRPADVSRRLGQRTLGSIPYLSR